jgi:D-sedoheptulose 7-phosphate isomerase
MTKFPEKSYNSIARYADDYFDCHRSAAKSVSREALGRAAEILQSAYGDGKWIYACGNGGSAAISDHLMCDHLKCVRTDTELSPRIMSLASNASMLTAIANDMSYEDIYIYQLQSLARPGDVLITISSSGDSENIVRAVSWGRENGMRTIAMTGFGGGRSAKIADVNLHVQGDNYGVVEDVHQGLMHILAQFIRQAHIEEAKIPGLKF